MTAIGLLTAVVSLGGAAAAVALRPAPAIATYLVILIVWPNDVLLQPFGTIEVEPIKFVVPFLLLNVVFKGNALRGFRFNALDLAIIGMVIAEGVAGAVNIPADDFLEHLGNSWLRTVLAYAVLRLGIQTREQWFLVLRACVYAAGFVAAICVYETATGVSFYHWFVATVGGYDWRAPWPPRFGLFRAVGSFNNPLPTGLLFAFLAPVSLMLRHDEKWSPWKTAFFVPLMLAGMFATMSSGPVFAMAAAVAVIAFFPFRRLAPAAGGIGLAVAVGWLLLGPQLGVASVTEVVSAGAYDSVNAGYRARLVEEALTGGMDNHWVFGYGRVGLGTDDPDSPEFNWVHQDLVNMWILNLVFFGLFGLVSLFLVNAAALVRLGIGVYANPSPRTDFAVWLMLSAFIGWQVAFMAVAPLAPLSTFYYAMLGVISNVPLIVSGWQNQAVNRTPERLWPRDRAAAVPA